MIHLTPHEIANEIRMTRSEYTGAFLIVEGQDDYQFMVNFISLSTCTIEVARGKQNVCDVIDILDEDNFNGVLGLIDADFDRIEGGQQRSQNLVMPECHDLDMMLVSSPALDRILTALGSRDKLETFQEDVLKALMERALPLGYLRLHSLRERLNLRFRGLRYSAWIDRSSFEPNTTKLINTVKNHSQRQDLSSSDLAIAIEELQDSNYDPYEMCNGADVIGILSVGLRRVLGTKDAGEVGEELLKMSLRLAYSEQHFRSSSLRKDIETWQRRNHGFQILRSDII